MLRLICTGLVALAAVGCTSPQAALIVEPTAIVLNTHSAITPVVHNREPNSYDWPTRHARTKALMAESLPDLVFIGDSIFHNIGGPITEATRPPKGQAVWDEYYAPRNAVNLGFGWDRTENVIYRLQDNALVGSTPKVAVVMIGTNNLHLNSPAEIAEGVTAICELIHRQSPTTSILLLAVFPRSDPGGLAHEAVREALNERISRLDARDYITFADIAAIFYDEQARVPRDLMYDGLHPTAEGYRRMAEAIEPYLQAALE